MLQAGCDACRFCHAAGRNPPTGVLDELHVLVAQLDIGITEALLRLNSLPR